MVAHDGGTVRPDLRIHPHCRAQVARLAQQGESLPLPLPLPLTPSSSTAFCPSFTNVPCARYLSYHMCCTRTQVHRYSYKHFADPSGGGEWFGYLNRGECTAPGPLYGYCTVSSCYKDVQLPGVDNSQLRT